MKLRPAGDYFSILDRTPGELGLVARRRDLITPAASWGDGKNCVIDPAGLFGHIDRLRGEIGVRSCVMQTLPETDPCACCTSSRSSTCTGR
ncbi:hypothetical protein SBD_1410 [Streptomyces bottropensis ATCC 25435]|uniref:Uncharacterized protein n=1 Tax=Streptomyces bottropensis ATCC 25435 TaxID=1054862 RepID=M3F6L5_9ACTN|nr:hypothetical protein SBD_1410 [Streptomyces bottropensis ATCC 25435]